MRVWPALWATRIQRSNRWAFIATCALNDPKITLGSRIRETSRQMEKQLIIMRALPLEMVQTKISR